MIDQLHFLIKGTAYLLDEGERKLFESFNLSSPRFYLLNHLYHHPGIAPSELSEKMLCHRSNVTRLVRGLEKEGLLLRAYDEVDYRTIHLRLTSKGETVIQQARQAYERHLRERIALIQPTERRLIIEQLQDLYRVLES